MDKEISTLATSDVSAQKLLQELRKMRPARKKIDWGKRSLGERCSDAVAELVGSWIFIIVQGALLSLWIVVNVMAWIQAWDPYPFILLNLLLSFQAAFTAPIIMMSQNRQNAVDRLKAEHDYEINIKAELEIEQLHEKIDLLRTQEIQQLIDIIRSLEGKIGQMSQQGHS